MADSVNRGSHKFTRIKHKAGLVVFPDAAEIDQEFLEGWIERRRAFGVGDDTGNTDRRLKTVEDYTIGQNTRTQFRALNLIIEAHCRGTANIDDTLDTIAEEVEEAMVTDISRGGNAKDTKLVSTEVDFDTASQKTGLMRLTYLISYNTIENAVQTGV